MSITQVQVAMRVASTVAKKRAGQEDVDSDYLFGNCLQHAVLVQHTAREGFFNTKAINRLDIGLAFVLVLDEAVVVKPIILICLCLTSLGCVASDGFDNRNFAIDTYFPNTNEIQLAEGRARNYWARNGTRFGPEPRYLAVDTSNLFPYGGLYPKLINSETTASFFSHGAESNTYSNLVLTGVTIYDTKTAHVVGNQGYVSVDTPNPGEVARFGDYTARWIGTGHSFF